MGIVWHFRPAKPAKIINRKIIKKKKTRPQRNHCPPTQVGKRKTRNKNTQIFFGGMGKQWGW